MIFSTICSTYEERKNQSEYLLQILKNYPNTEEVNKILIVKSCYCLMLYNIVESTMYNICEYIHEKLSQKTFSELNSEYQHIMLEYYFDQKKIKSCRQNFDKLIQGKLKFPNFSDYIKQKKIFSGNLDAQKIDNVLKWYKIHPLSVANREHVKDIKDIRNKLAHGEQNFLDATRNMTIQQLEIFRDDVYSVMKNVLDIVSTF